MKYFVYILLFAYVYTAQYKERRYRYFVHTSMKYFSRVCASHLFWAPQTEQMNTCHPLIQKTKKCRLPQPSGEEDSLDDVPLRKVLGRCWVNSLTHWDIM